MTETKHTPAPWVIYRNGISNYRDGTGAAVYLLKILDFDSFSEGEQHLANEKLIAAAPELFDALEAMLEQYDQFETDCILAHEMAHKALAKARGETTFRPVCEKCDSLMMLDGCYVCECGHKQSSF